MRETARILVVLNRLITMYISLNFQVCIMLVLYSIFLICPFDVGNDSRSNSFKYKENDKNQQATS
jgi:hypothetical protein